MSKNEKNEEIEQRLGSILQPVSPENNYITDLQEQLKKKVNVIVENPDYFVITLFVISGFFIGIVLLWLLRIICGNTKKNE